ncbi:MAG: hypothetical protein ABI402_17150 [Ferruginibacter sp.]
MNYKKILTILPATFLALFSFCQSKLTIISGEDGSSLPYATIVNVTKKYNLSASKTGEAIIDVSPGDSIAISYVGYKDVGFIISKEQEKIISIYRVTEILPEIFVSNCKKMKQFVLKNPIKPRKQWELISGMNWSYSDLLKPYAILIKDIPPNSQITMFSFWLRKQYVGPADSMILAPIMLMAYAVDSLTQLPGKPLISKPIIFYPEKQGKQSLNLDSVQLVMPGNGIYISIQCVMDKKYSWEDKNAKTRTGNDTTMILYGGIFQSGSNITNFKPVIYDQSKKEWVSFIYNIVIGFEIEYKRCKN